MLRSTKLWPIRNNMNGNRLKIRFLATKRNPECHESVILFKTNIKSLIGVSPLAMAESVRS